LLTNLIISNFQKDDFLIIPSHDEPSWGVRKKPNQNEKTKNETDRTPHRGRKKPGGNVTVLLQSLYLKIG